MPRLINIDQLERTLARGEQSLNLLGYVPLISTMSAAVRFLGGMLQIILGLTLTVVYFCFLGFSETRKIKHFLHLKSSFAQAFHGLGNVIRSKIEAIPFLSLVTCLPYDRLLKKRFKYSVEKWTDIEVEVEDLS